MTAVPGNLEPEGMPPEVAARVLRALNCSPSALVTLLNPDLSIAWLSQSASWVTGTDPGSRMGENALDRIHPDDVERLLHGVAQLRAANAVESPAARVIEPLRYRFQRFDGRWVVMEAVIHNLLDDPIVGGLLVESRPVDNGLDAVGHVVDLLVADAALPDVLAACARLVPAYLGSTAVVALVDGRPVIGAPPASPAERLSADDRWWRHAIGEGRTLAPADFADFPDDLAEQARAEGFRTAWVIPLVERSSTDVDVIGCVAIWVLIDGALSIAVDTSLRQTERLASLVIGEERRRHVLRREAVTDPLTGLGNRSALRRRLDATTGPVTMAIVDLDAFKPINDTYGHSFGDAVLQTVADRLRGAVREDDLVVRFGGDEFAIVFADETSPHSATRVARRIVDAIEAPIAVSGPVTVAVGASIGLATAAAGSVVRQADRALYDAKRSKRRPGSPVRDSAAADWLEAAGDG
jgi:diguanylate cyclase (GGDEF)-like protein